MVTRLPGDRTSSKLRRDRVLALVLFLAAFGVRLAWTIPLSARTPTFEGEVQRIAISMLKGEGFANPYIVPTGYTAHLAPLQPLLQSVIYRAFGFEREGEAVRLIFNSLCIALSVALFPSIAARLNLPPPAAAFAGLAACWPSHIREIAAHFGEPLTVLLGVVSFRLLLSTGTPTPAIILAQGLSIGLLALLNPVAAAGAAGLFVVRRVCPIGAGSAGLRTAAIPIAIAALAVTPWIVRTYLRLGGFVLLRSNLGLELRVAYSPKATPDFIDNFTPHPNTDKVEARRAAAIGEIAYNREKRDQAIEWIRDNPSAAVTLVRRRIVAYWLPDIVDGRLARYLCWALTVAGWAGLLVMYFYHRHACWWLTWLTIWNFGFYIWFSIDFRYRLPNYWTTLLCAGYLAALLIERNRIAFTRPAKG